MSRRGNALATILLGGVSLAISLAAAEGGLRLHPPPGFPLSTTHPALGHTFVPNLRTTWYDTESAQDVPISVNAFGLRDDWTGHEQAKPRVMVVGDSFVDGIQVDETERFTEIAEHRLQQLYPTARVLNLGKGGLAPNGYLRYVEHFSPMLQPDVTIVALFNGNDFGEVLDSGTAMLNWVVRGGQAMPYAEIATPTEKLLYRLRVFAGRFYTALLAKNAWVLWRQRSRARTAQAPACPFWFDPEDRRMRDSFQIIERILLEIREKAVGTLGLLQIPSAAQVYPHRYREFACEREPPREWPTETWLADFSARHRIPLLQLLPRMQAQTGPELYWSHFNRAGHEFAGEALADFVLRLHSQPR